MKYLKQLIAGDLRKIAKEKDVPKLGNAAGKLEKVDEKKIGQTSGRNLEEIAKEVEALGTMSPSLQTQKMKNIVRTLEEISGRLEESGKKEALAKLGELKEIIEEVENLIKTSEVGTIKDFKAMVEKVEEEVDALNNTVKKEKKLKEID